MSAPITDADRAAAHAALIEKPITCDDMRPGISHDWICEDVAQAIADAREAENQACEAIASDRAKSAEEGQGYYGEGAMTADAIADQIAARRSR